jgi:hypothetical protein
MPLKLSRLLGRGQTVAPETQTVAPTLPQGLEVVSEGYEPIVE